MIEEVKVIRHLASRTEQMAQLAEEASELAVAALELKKHIVFKDSVCNKLEADLIEEIADVKLTIDIIGNYLEKINLTPFNHLYSKYELFEMLAKYSCELAKASIKLRRTIIVGANPTPVTTEEAEHNLITIISNIRLCVNAIGNYWDSDEVKRIYKEKAIRFINRITNI